MYMTLYETKVLRVFLRSLFLFLSLFFLFPSDFGLVQNFFNLLSTTMMCIERELQTSFSDIMKIQLSSGDTYIEKFKIHYLIDKLP